MARPISKWKNNLGLVGALLLAFALRVYLLGAQSLWNDEGTSVALSSLSLPAIINGAAHDIHPPLYYFLLHFWMPLVGKTEYAVRFLSVIAGILIVALTFRLARFFFDQRVALVAAFIAAVSSFQVYYSQEARMYIWVTLFAAVSVYAMAKMLEVRSWKLEIGERASDSEPLTSNLQSLASNLQSPTSNSRTRRSLFWLLYIAATIAMLYTQYVGAFVVIAENLAFAVWLFFVWRSAISGQPSSVLRRPSSVKHSFAFWVAAQAIAGLAFLPWYLLAGNQLATWPSISEPLDLPTLVWRVLNVFSVGLTLEGNWAAIVSVLLGILFLLGWRRATGRLTNWLTVLLILWTLVPIGAMYVVSLSRPAYNPKFLLLATPPFFILAARGLTQVTIGNWRFVIRGLSFAICSFVILFASAYSLNNYYFDPAYARDDYRAILQTIDATARPGDGILVDAPGQIDVVRYYLRSDPQLFLLPRMRPPDPAITRADVDEMLGKVRRLFAIYYATEQSDPQGIVETRLAEKAFKARDEWYGNVRLAVYGIAPAPRGAAQPLDAQVGDAITLARYQLDQRAARPGDILTLTLDWQANQTPSARYKVFVHLLDANDHIVAQRDGEPVGDTRVTTTWRAGERIDDHYGIWIEPGTPPGQYRVEIGMYRADDGARLAISRGGQNIGDHLILGTVMVK